MTNLEKLQEIARAATSGTRHWSDDTEIKVKPYSDEYALTNGDGKFVLGYAGCGSHKISVGKDDAKFIATFNPRLIEKMLAEIKAAREIIESEDKHIRHYCHQPYVETYDKAREAFDQELAGGVG